MTKNDEIRMPNAELMTESRIPENYYESDAVSDFVIRHSNHFTLMFFRR